MAAALWDRRLVPQGDLRRCYAYMTYQAATEYAVGLKVPSIGSKALSGELGTADFVLLLEGRNIEAIDCVGRRIEQIP